MKTCKIFYFLSKFLWIFPQNRFNKSKLTFNLNFFFVWNFNFPPDFNLFLSPDWNFNFLPHWDLLLSPHWDLDLLPNWNLDFLPYWFCYFLPIWDLWGIKRLINFGLNFLLGRQCASFVGSILNLLKTNRPIQQKNYQKPIKTIQKST